MVVKLRRKFIIIASLSLLAVNLITENGGELPTEVEKDRSTWNFNDMDITVESKYENRYFYVVMNQENNTVVRINRRHIAAVSDNQTKQFTYDIIRRHKKQGMYRSGDYIYFYKVTDLDDSQSQVVFLDITNRMGNHEMFLQISIMVGILGLLVFMFLLIGVSGRAIRPMIENEERQKQFITNAGHELKTPLAVISANTEVIEMMNGKSEWTESIENQIKRLNGLVSDLITLSKNEEAGTAMKEKVDFSAKVSEVAGDFKTIVENQHCEFESEIGEELYVKGDPFQLRELANILTDNAAKYCDPNGKVSVVLQSRPRWVELRVSNTYEEGKDQDFSKFFDRFYRGDTSHNAKKSGYGIGLSMAATIVKGHKGKLQVNYKDSVITFVVLLMPYRSERKKKVNENRREES